MITADLLPVLVIVLNIEWVNQITTGEIIAISISGAIIIWAAINLLWKLISPSRTYAMKLFDSSIDRIIPSNGNEVSEFRLGQDSIAEVHVRIVAKTGVNIENIRFRLANRVFPYWRLVAERGRRAFIEDVKDKDLERETKYSQDGPAGILHYFSNRRLLKGDIVWYRVWIHANGEWNGYLEFRGPSGDNRHACSRHKITLQSNTDKGDSQT